MSETSLTAKLNESFSAILDIDDEVFAKGFNEEMRQNLIDMALAPETIRRQIVEFQMEGLSYEEVEKECSNFQVEVGMLKDDLEESEELGVEKRQFIGQFFDALIQAMDEVKETYPRFFLDVPIYVGPNGTLPTRAHSTDAGIDIYSAEDVTFEPGNRILVHTDLYMDIPNGWQLSVRPRSSVSYKTGLRVANAPATIDSHYTSELMIIMENTGDTPHTILKGERIAQGLWEKVYKARFIEVDSKDALAGSRANEKGEQGLGSTGV